MHHIAPLLLASSKFAVAVFKDLAYFFGLCINHRNGEVWLSLLQRCRLLLWWFSEKALAWPRKKLRAVILTPILRSLVGKAGSSTDERRHPVTFILHDRLLVDFHDGIALLVLAVDFIQDRFDLPLVVELIRDYLRRHPLHSTLGQALRWTLPCIHFNSVLIEKAGSLLAWSHFLWSRARLQRFTEAIVSCFLSTRLSDPKQGLLVGFLDRIGVVSWNRRFQVPALAFLVQKNIVNICPAFKLGCWSFLHRVERRRRLPRHLAMINWLRVFVENYLLITQVVQLPRLGPWWTGIPLI